MFGMLKDTRRWNKVVLFLLVLTVLTITACDNSGQQKSKPSHQPISWTQASEDNLMRQVAEHELERGYSRYLPDELIAAADIYGLDWEGNQGTAYATIMACEFVTMKGKAYMMSSSSGEVIIRFNFDGQYPKLEKLEWSGDGIEHDKWLKENFPAEYLKKYKNTQKQKQPGEDAIEKKIRNTVKELMDASVEVEDLLEIDQEKGTYEIIRIIEGYDENGEYNFDFDTIEKGSLKDLSEVKQLVK